MKYNPLIFAKANKIIEDRKQAEEKARQLEQQEYEYIDKCSEAFICPKCGANTTRVQLEYQYGYDEYKYTCSEIPKHVYNFRRYSDEDGEQ